MWEVKNFTAREEKLVSKNCCKKQNDRNQGMYFGDTILWKTLKFSYQKENLKSFSPNMIFFHKIVKEPLFYAAYLLAHIFYHHCQLPRIAAMCFKQISPDSCCKYMIIWEYSLKYIFKEDAQIFFKKLLGLYSKGAIYDLPADCCKEEMTDRKNKQANQQQHYSGHANPFCSQLMKWMVGMLVTVGNMLSQTDWLGGNWTRLS